MLENFRPPLRRFAEPLIQTWSRSPAAGRNQFCEHTHAKVPGHQSSILANVRDKLPNEFIFCGEMSCQGYESRNEAQVIQMTKSYDDANDAKDGSPAQPVIAMNPRMISLFSDRCKTTERARACDCTISTVSR